MIYASENAQCPPEAVLEKIRSSSEDVDETEFYIKQTELFINVKKTEIEQDGSKYLCYTYDDISEYTALVKEVAAYIKSISDMSKFQTSIMNWLIMPYDAFLPGLADFCGVDEVFMFSSEGDKVVKSLYKGTMQHITMTDPEEYDRYLSAKRGDKIDGFGCIVDLNIRNRHCTVFVKLNGTVKKNNFMAVSVHNTISLFIENSILREEIVYESEHDKLTGLYNKGKYMELKEKNFGNPRSITIYNFDVNNLKYINDNFGHEMGDALITKAAASIAATVSDNVLGFRMGGDEYVMVALDLTEEESENVRLQWQEALAGLNRADDGIFCAMACGMAYGTGNYEYEALYAKADELMYVNKKKLKSENISSHLK